MSPERLPWLARTTRKQEQSSRAARRRARRSEAEILNEQLTKLYDEFRLNADHFDEVSRENGYRFGKIIYQGEEFIEDYLIASRRLHLFIDRAQWTNLKRSFVSSDLLNQVESRDQFGTKVEDTSLSDIEKMPLPLSTDDIKRINKMWHEPFFGKSKNQERLVKYSMIYLATRSVVVPEKVYGSTELTPLAKHLTNYFDYYTNLMTDFSLNDEDETNFLMSLGWVGGFVQIRALGCYIPARLGITPASAIKLYHARAEGSIMSNFGWRKIIKAMADESQYAFIKNGLPEDLKDFGRYNPQMDKQAESIFLKYYEGKRTSGIEQAEGIVEMGSLLSRFGSDRSHIYREVRRSAEKRINVEMPEDHVASRVTVTTQNRETLILILHFKDNRGFLTLEIDKNNSLYGIPPKLASDYPHLSDVVLRDVLAPTLAKLAPEPVVVRRVLAVATPVPVEEESEEFEVREEKEPKRKRIREMLPLTKKEEPELPKPHEQPQRQFSVIHSRESVEEKLGKKYRPDDVDRIMETIRRFEFGQVPVKTIVWSEGKRQVIRKGKFRVILDHLGSGLYQIENVADREVAYEGFSDRRVY